MYLYLMLYFGFSGVCHIYICIKGEWRGMAVGEGCCVHFFEGVNVCMYVVISRAFVLCV